MSEGLAPAHYTLTLNMKVSSCSLTTSSDNKDHFVLPSSFVQTWDRQCQRASRNSCRVYMKVIPWAVTMSLLLHNAVINSNNDPPNAI